MWDGGGAARQAAWPLVRGRLVLGTGGREGRGGGTMNMPMSCSNVRAVSHRKLFSHDLSYVNVKDAKFFSNAAAKSRDAYELITSKTARDIASV